MKRFLSFLLILSFLAVILPGCASTKELWVVTECSDAGGIPKQVEFIINTFTKTHEDVSVKLDVLPSKKLERAIFLDELRTKIAEGNGPDVYLFATDLFNHEPLFSDVELTMRSGRFADLSSYYNADDTLGKEALSTVIMDAGTVGNARYVLPLAFEFPTLYVDTDMMEQAGISLDTLNAGISSVREAAIATGDTMWACGAEVYNARSGFNMFPRLIDYDAKQVLLTAREVADYMRSQQKNIALIGDYYKHRTFYDFSIYTGEGFSWDSLEAPMLGDSLRLRDIIDMTVISRIVEKPLTILPLRAYDGSLVADVTFYAAVDSDCREKELAYSLVREFLSEKNQWKTDFPYMAFRPVLGIGWPVRVSGSVDALWRNYLRNTKYMSIYGDGSEERMAAIRSQKLTQSDIPVLNETIDIVRFNIQPERTVYENLLYKLNVRENHYTPSDADIDALAEEVIQALQWHLDQG